MRIAVITPTISPCGRECRCVGRSEKLIEAQLSVKAQTLQPVVHLVESAVCSGPTSRSAVRNRLIAKARDDYECDWVALLDDDDLFDPGHLEILAAAAKRKPKAAMIYSDCRVTFHGKEAPRPWPRQGWDPVKLRHGNWIPVTVLLSVWAWEQYGGFGEEECEDWELWKRLADEEVAYVPLFTWTYRDPSWLR